MDRWLNSAINPDARYDWRAALIAGVIGCAVVWLLSHGIPWFTSGMVSPSMMGRDLKPPGLVDASMTLVTLVAQLGVSIAYALAIAPLVSRFRGMWAIALGGIIGIGLYLLNLAAFRLVFTDQWTGSELPVIVTHVVFSMVVAGAYKGLAARKLPAAQS